MILYTTLFLDWNVRLDDRIESLSPWARSIKQATSLYRELDPDKHLAASFLSCRIMANPLTDSIMSHYDTLQEQDRMIRRMMTPSTALTACSTDFPKYRL